MRKNWLFPAFALLLAAVLLSARGYAGFGTTVPVSAETATNIARSLFPVSLKSGNDNLFLTDPVVIFVDDRRIGLIGVYVSHSKTPFARVVAATRSPSWFAGLAARGLPRLIARLIDTGSSRSAH